METIKNLNLKYVDENYYKEISTQADLKSSLNGINIKKQDLKRNNKDFKKKEYFKIKSDYTKNKLALVSLKEGRKNKIKKILYELDREIFVLKKKETKNYVSENKKILKTKFDEEKRLLSFSLNNEEKIKEYILLLEKKYHKDLAILEKYSFSENTNVMINKIKQEKYAEIKDIDLNFKIKSSELKKNLFLKKKKFYKNWLHFKFENHKKIKEKNKDFRKQKRIAILDSKKAQKELINKNIYLNALFEPIREDKNKISKIRFPKISWKEASKNFQNENFKNQLTKIYILEKKLENELKNSDDSFNSKLKILEFTVKIDHEKKVLNILKNYNEKIENALIELKKTPKKSLKVEQKIEEKISHAKLEYKNEIKRIKNEYLNGDFSKTSKKNSLVAAKKHLNSEKKSAYLLDEYLIAKEKVKFLNIDKKRQIEKEYKIMYSAIDDAQKNIPTKISKNQKWYALFLSLLLPGLGQILNKQYLKGILILFISVFMWAFLIPVTFGFLGSKDGSGIFGFGNLSPNVGNVVIGDIYLDARFRLVEAIISIMTLSLSVVIILASSRDAYITGKWLSQGIRSKNSRYLKKYLANSGLPLIISTPAFIFTLLIVVLPLAATILLAFTDYGSSNGTPGITVPLKWVGFENFTQIFTGDYGKSFAFVSGWTIIWTLSVSIGVIVVGTFLALIVDNPRIKGKIFWSTVYILPWAVPAFATILFFSIAFGNGTNGIYNQIFGSSIDFQGSEFWARFILILIQIWLGHAYIFLLITGVKKSISNDFYEAASIDGASKWKQFWKITAPIVLVQIFPLLIGQIVFNFNNFGVIFLFNGGGPSTVQAFAGNPGSTDIIISLIFKLTTSVPNRIALASAFTLIVSIFIVIISSVIFVRSKSFKGGRI